MRGRRDKARRAQTEGGGMRIRAQTLDFGTRDGGRGRGSDGGRGRGGAAERLRFIGR